MSKITVTRSLSTGLTVERVEMLADAAGVMLTHLDTRLAGKGKWLNDFEVVGPPGKVDAFFERVDEIRND